ncbi:MAG TPA: hypothetical protein VGK99_24025 [Acidobacteriota bacterium]|jgi:DNA-directed RNA polymerase specialized sigma24 family protein
MKERKVQWTVNQAAFEKLLDLLDSDRERAGEKYEKIRQRLADFFRWRGCATPYEYVDIAMDRVARKLGEGASVQGNPYLYFHGVAVNLLREHWRAPESRTESLDPESLAHLDLPGLSNTHFDAVEEWERTLECLDRCLRSLSSDSRGLLLQYHSGEARDRIENRRKLAANLQIPLNALRIRLFRVRQSLELCVTRCLGDGLKYSADSVIK